MRRRSSAMVVAGVILIAVIGAVTRNQMKVYRQREARAELAEQRRLLATQSLEAVRRQALYDVLQPVALANCQVERFGEPHDGGYLLCSNLLGAVQSGYSYGISGYDQWGCDISTKFNIPVHQYDCFDTTQPACPSGRTIFHAECVGDTALVADERVFDTVRHQMEKNGDSSKRIVMKMDVEGAEWPSLMSAPDEVLARVDQLVVEFHFLRNPDGGWIQDDVYQAVVLRLKQFFEIANLHFNNASCTEDVEPFPTWAYEVLFVSKRLAVVDPTRTATTPHPLDAPNAPDRPDCHPRAG